MKYTEVRPNPEPTDRGNSIMFWIYLVGVFMVVALIILFTTVLSRGQSPIGIENSILDIPDGYHLYEQDTVKAILLISSDEWSADEEYFGFPELMCGYVVKCSYRFCGNGKWIAKKNRILLSKQKYLDNNKIELKNCIVWSANENVSYVQE